MELEGKVAVVSGGSKGIGRGIARRLAMEGADVVIAARTRETLEQTARDITSATGRTIHAVEADLSELGGCEELHRRVAEAFGRTDILVNCAGAVKSGPFLDLPDDAWHAGFDLKFFGAVRLSRLFWPMLTEARGTVIMIDGGRARTPDPGFTIVGSVNAALASFGKALAGLGLRDDVNVNVVHPGMTRTERLEEIAVAQTAGTDQSVEEFIQAAIDRQGIRRLGTPEDIAEVVAFLCTPRARHVQGTAIAVDGGATKGLY